MSGVHVLVHLREPEDERGGVLAAYREARAQLDGTPGLLADRLLRSVTDAGRLTLLMEWADRPSYEHWEREHRRRGHPSPLRRYQDRDRPGGHHELFAVAEARSFTPPAETPAETPAGVLPAGAVTRQRFGIRGTGPGAASA
ncbi:antibiotic biosynthesis monooxygenase family protein [Actinomadura rupiterrae]|uniref:antibiotic biosynthesis monooxygenase family protein n=1 Tax=Actinomadura rupiterrae TaxID=559627 RepID=UPI0020A3184D|nr:antibiotic biosynthesis monooxygenase family protein [Actinomadura rupiterrae]MCP2341064.1 heme-degrading monooxygenase HmoA [Actinomadura rupiterrae]